MLAITGVQMPPATEGEPTEGEPIQLDYSGSTLNGQE